MGDGRYYTLAQFGSTIWLTLLLLAILPTTVISYYKAPRYKWRIASAGVLLSITFLFHFIAELIDIESGIPFFYMLKNISLIVYVSACLYSFITIYLKGIKIDKIMALLIFSLFFLAVIILLLVPNMWWLAYGMVTVQYMLLSNQLMIYSLGVTLFSDIKDMVLDYVFVTDIDGNLLFASEQVGNSDFFAIKNKMDLADIASFFKDKVTLKQQFGKQFIRLKNDNKRYFQFYKKEIYSIDRVVGYILTFVDISELIIMLDEYDAKREVVFKSNVRLRRYKDRVYEIEREKEVNRLFLEIAQNQEKSLNVLNEKIKQLDIDNELFTSNINDLIMEAKTNLKDVRMAVSAYKTYYEGE